jgi:hypothetical protein
MSSQSQELEANLPALTDSMSASFRHLVQNLRSLIAGDTPGNSRLQLSITTQPSPLAGEGGPAADAATILQMPAAQQEHQPVLSGSSDGVRLPAGATLPSALQPASSRVEEGLASAASHGSSGAASEPSDVASAAEHHRLTSLNSSVDLRAVALALERGLPYAILLLLLFLSTHLVVRSSDGMEGRASLRWECLGANAVQGGAACAASLTGPFTHFSLLPAPSSARAPPPPHPPTHPHITQGLSMYAYLSLVLFRLNAIIRGQVALKQDRRARKLLAAAVAALAHVPAVLLLLNGQDMAGNLMLDGRRKPSKVG